MDKDPVLGIPRRSSGNIDSIKQYRQETGEVACVVLAACTTSGDPLAGTNWRLVEFQSMDGCT